MPNHDHTQSMSVNSCKGGLYVIHLSESHWYGGRTANFNKRKARHLGDLRRGTHANPHMQAVYNIYGRFEFEVLAYIPDAEDRIAAEQKWLDDNIGNSGCVNIGSSAQEGQPPGFRHSPEAKLKISRGNRGRVKSAEERSRISAALKGRPLSSEHRASLSASLRGRTLSPAHCASLSASKKGRSPSPETRAKIRAALKGQACSPERRAKISLANTGKVKSAATRALISEQQRGRVWINNGEKNRRLFPEKAQPYLERGWVHGRFTR